MASQLPRNNNVHVEFGTWRQLQSWHVENCPNENVEGKVFLNCFQNALLGKNTPKS
jgi:hypothetical protein